MSPGVASSFPTPQTSLPVCSWSGDAATAGLQPAHQMLLFMPFLVFAQRHQQLYHKPTHQLLVKRHNNCLATSTSCYPRLTNNEKKMFSSAEFFLCHCWC